MQKTFEIASSTIYPLGVNFTSEGLHISAVFEAKDACGIVLFDKRHKEGVKIPFPKENRKGNVYSMLLKGYQDRSCSYLFYQGENLFQDPYAKAIISKKKYGEKQEQPSHCLVLDKTYDWENDKAPVISFEDSIFYMLHVRGFTKHTSSGVRAKGTYQGIMEKIPYLKELGITAVILMPSYEFDEVLLPERRKQPVSMEEAVATYKEPLALKPESEEETIRVNFWGYQDGLYFLPKYTYAYTKDAVTEYKDMVKALHQNGIEVIMQFYFQPETSYVFMLDILKYWAIEYHIDGFHLLGADIPMYMLRKEPVLAETKLLGEREIGEINCEDKNDFYRNYGLLSDSFLYDIRKLLKGDDNQINNFIYHSRNNSREKGIVNYIAKQDGFRLFDLVSYDRKHNMANGESNQDGTSYNCSWNCGTEGPSRKKAIQSLRIRQMKNALTFVLLSQGTPLLFSGDEFANTQNGNNNPYCQDNATCWIKWNLQKTNQELLQYTKDMIAFRKTHKIFHRKEPLRGMDYLSCGYPDVSYHGKEAWSPDTGPVSRSIGIMYCAKYGLSENDAEENMCELFYVGVNMHWETHMLGLPMLPKGKEWVPLFSTQAMSVTKEKLTQGTEEQEELHNVLIPARTIMIFGTKEASKKRKKISKKDSV